VAEGAPLRGAGGRGAGRSPVRPGGFRRPKGPARACLVEHVEATAGLWMESRSLPVLASIGQKFESMGQPKVTWLVRGRVTVEGLTGQSAVGQASFYLAGRREGNLGVIGSDSGRVTDQLPGLTRVG